MKFLQVIVLPAILVSYVAGSFRALKYYFMSSPKGCVVEKSPMKSVLARSSATDRSARRHPVPASVQVQRLPVELTERGLDHDVNIDDVIRSENVDYITESIGQLDQANAYTLGELCLTRKEIVEKVLEKVTFPQEALIEVASSTQLTNKPLELIMLLNKITNPEDRAAIISKGVESMPVEAVKMILEGVNLLQTDLTALASSQGLACDPEKFLLFLGKITTPEDQMATLERSIENLLAYPHRQCIPPLLIAMRGKPLEDVAVKKAFKGVTETDGYEPGVLWCTFEHPAITHEVYAGGLLASAKSHILTRTFKWLLERADVRDLRALQDEEGYNDLRADVHASVAQAVKSLSGGERRLPPTATESTPTSRGAFNDLHPHMLEYESVFAHGI